jgi:hypothetical protein
LIIEISKDISVASLREAKINIHDIVIDVLDIADEGIRALVIKLDNEQNLDVFVKLCFDLIERVTTSEKNENTFHTICQRLRKWQSLLSGKSRKLLSATEIQGLYAELYFIGEMLAQDTSNEALLINGWEGPERKQQDFILADTAVEVKSIAGNQRRKVRISSEDQLDTHLDKLYLRVYFLSEALGGKNGESLNAIVSRVAGQLTSRENKEIFERKLEAARYIDIPEYSEPLFRVSDCHTYLAEKDFPRITRQDLPEGVEAVSYDLVLAAIEKFRITAEIMGK